MQKKTIEGEEQLHAALRPNLLAWLKADKGVEVESLQECIATGSGSSCNVKSWRSQVGSESSQYKFTPASRDQLLPLFLPSISDRNKLPALYFACPMQNEALRLHDYMTLFFVLSPAQIEAGNSYKGQKFFGNSPYGQFFFHGGKPGFLSGGGVRELDTVASSGNFYLLTYRLHRNSVEIKMNGQSWGPRITSDTNGNNNDAAFAVRMSDNAALSLGNVKPICDTNAFQGRIAEVMVYDTILTDTQVRDVETYLQQKWWDAPFDISDTGATPDGDITEVPADTREDTAAAEANDAIKNEQTALDSTSTAAVKDTNLIEIHDDNEPQDEDDLEAATQPPLQSEETKESMSPPEPVTFDPEYVFDWTPSQELLAAKAEKAATLGVDLTVEWAKAVKERVDAIRGFQFGGDVLRAYIRSRKEELLALRQELFG
uniref:Uncharacterized protein n=1 Tax=Globisporangium ultimum (strain ATCC 200006 / CBS 805.95 / DAOM BR144) TaxID=431595 RepID=K3WSX6_GLOUD